MKEDHKEIYLEPLFDPEVINEPEWYDRHEGRQWCQDNVWDESAYCGVKYHGVKPTKYIRADLYEKLETRIKHLEEDLEAAEGFFEDV